MLNVKQFQLKIVRPVLHHMEMWSPVAEALMMGTPAQESDFYYFSQYPTGPAKGFFQMEDATHEDIWDSYLAYRSDIRKRVLVFVSRRPSAHELIGNVNYAVAMCRLKYWRNSRPLPDRVDPIKLADYWKEIYNTKLGKGTREEFVESWERHKLGELSYQL